MSKEQYIAQYWGQKVLTLGDNHNYEVNFNWMKIVFEAEETYSHLELRSISQLTDEELIKCYHLHSGIIGYDYTQDFKDVLTMAKHWIEMDGINALAKYTCTADYLRSIGINLYSEAIEKGWCKIQGV